MLQQNRLKELRDLLRLTQKELCTVIGTTQANVSRWETFRGTPTHKFIRRINIIIDEYGVDGFKYFDKMDFCPRNKDLSPYPSYRSATKPRNHTQ